jgi:hypothetical protein
MQSVNPAGIKICPKCQSQHPLDAQFCPCGHTFRTQFVPQNQTVAFGAQPIPQYQPGPVIDPYAPVKKPTLPPWAQITLGISLSFVVIVGAVIGFFVFTSGFVQDVPYCDLNEKADVCRIATTTQRSEFMLGMESQTFTFYHGRASSVIDRDGVLVMIYNKPDGEMHAHFTFGGLSEVFLYRSKPLKQIN